MKLFTQEWNTAQTQTALLIHGIGSQSTVWHRMAEYLSSQGYHVIAPDLSGHGLSHKTWNYSVKSWVDDIVDTLEDFPAPTLIVGHSLGGLLAAGVAMQLTSQPQQLILIDPAWNLPSGLTAWVTKRVLRRMSKYTAGSIHKSKPTWSGKEILIELEAIRNWDARTVEGLSARECRQIIREYLKLHSGVNTSIIKPVNSLLVNRRVAKKFSRHGIHLLGLPKTGHNLHRDDHHAFVEAMENVMSREVGAI
jgi:pimeloyl-ACP methyl ester carboxylesterase